MTFRSAFSWIIRITISVLAIGYALYGVNWNEVGQTLARFKLEYIPFLVMLSLIMWILRALRLRAILGGRRSLTRCYLGMAVEVFGNIFLPLRAGDLIRCFTLSRLFPDTSMAFQIGAYLVEKALELFSLIAIVVLFLLIDPREEPVLFHMMLIAMAGLGLLGGLFVVMGWTHSWLPNRMRAMVEDLSSGFSTVLRSGMFGWAVAYTLMIRLCGGALFLILFQASQLPATYWDALFLISLAMLASLIPAAPGFVGTYEVMIVLGFGLLGLPKSEAIAFAVVSHGWHVLMWLVVGLSGVLLVPKGLISWKKSERSGGFAR